MGQMATIKDRIAGELARVYQEAYGEPDFDVAATLNYCDPEFGDLASNIALKSAKTLGLKPAEVAQAVVKRLKDGPIVEKAEVAGPGFINITLKPEVWRDFANQLEPGFIRSDQGKGETVNLEFVSANPTGPLVLVNAWAGYYGDVLGNILASQGYQVAREYYVNNIGLQIENLGKSVQAALGKEFSEAEKQNFYPGDYVEMVADQLADEYGSKERVGEQAAAEIGQKAADIMLARFIKPSLARLEVDFDRFFLESSLDNEATLKRLKDAGVVKEYDGATWLDGAKIGIEKDEVLVRGNGVGTYFLSDISYQLDKLEKRHFDQVISVFGADHHGHAKRLKQVLKFLGFDNLDVLTVQIVRLIKNGQELKMSKRAGNFIEVEKLFDEVPSAVARFFFVSHDVGTHMSFDLDIVAERTRSNPFFYTNYAYARAHSILRAAEEAKLTLATKISHDLSKKEIEILKRLLQLKQIVVEITTNYRVHNLIHGFVELAEAFHEYYESERIIKLDRTQAESKLALIQKFIKQADDTFRLIGVIPEERM